MPSNEDKPTTAVATTATTTATAATAANKKVEEEEEEEDLEQAVIKAEIEAGQAMLVAQNKLARAKKKLADSLNSPEDQNSKGYGVKIWAGETILQCLYCPLDVPANEEDRMIAHMDATHPDFKSKPPTYDNLGNALA